MEISYLFPEGGLVYKFTVGLVAHCKLDSHAILFFNIYRALINSLCQFIFDELKLYAETNNFNETSCILI